MARRNRAVVFRGLSIPTTGVVATRDYLRDVLKWLELWAKIVHLCNLIALCVLVCLCLWLAFHTTGSMKNDLTFNEVFMTSFVYFSSAFSLLIFYIANKINEAVLRVVPASIRYWIELEEEKRRQKTA
jgi:hypothetical protein